MNTTLPAAALILSCLLTPIANAAPPVHATLTLVHDEVLPGVPFDLIVTYKNVSNEPVTVGGALATLVVTFDNGETSVMHRPEGNDQWNLTSNSPLRLAPGQSGQQVAGWQNGSVANWFRYSSFSGPGTYGIALDLQIADEHHDPFAAVRTSPVTLTRIEPTGIDAALWKRMQAMSNGKWSDDSFQATQGGEELAREIIQLHPSSGYYPYVLALRGLRSPHRDHIPALLEAAERFTESPARPYVLMAAANSARYEGRKAERARNATEALKYFAIAEQNYNAALATKAIAVRGRAEAELREVMLGVERVKKQAR